ncbi:MAG: DUF4280 domain-containing protein [Alphaproteobacteria bacterium]
MATCSMGAAPSPLMFLPPPVIMAPTPAGTIMAMIPFVNILPFGVCTSLANPEVAAATAAALGVLVPMPCVPVPVSPWAPGSPKVMFGPFPALGACDTIMCAWAGEISMSGAAQNKVFI